MFAGFALYNRDITIQFDEGRLCQRYWRKEDEVYDRKFSGKTAVGLAEQAVPHLQRDSTKLGVVRVAASSGPAGVLLQLLTHVWRADCV